MPACPKCGNKEEAPSRFFTVIVEPAKGERGLTERKVGMYTCSKCGTKFPAVLSRQHYLIVAAEELRGIQQELKAVTVDNEELKSRVQAMAKEQERLQTFLEKAQKDTELKQLETKFDELETYVKYLRKEREELEQKALRLR